MASIVERRGRFCVVYSYKDKNGKRRQKWETYKTMSEAKKRKKEIEYRADIGQMIVPHCKTVKELMAKNPVIYATVPKYKSAKREIWTAETLMHALEVYEDDCLKLALNLAFSCSLRMGEMLGLP